MSDTPETLYRSQGQSHSRMTVDSDRLTISRSSAPSPQSSPSETRGRTSSIPTHFPRTEQPILSLLVHGVAYEMPYALNPPSSMPSVEWYSVPDSNVALERELTQLYHTHIDEAYGSAHEHLSRLASMLEASGIRENAAPDPVRTFDLPPGFFNKLKTAYYTFRVSQRRTFYQAALRLQHSYEDGKGRSPQENDLTATSSLTEVNGALPAANSTQPAPVISTSPVQAQNAPPMLPPNTLKRNMAQPPSGMPKINARSQRSSRVGSKGDNSFDIKNWASRSDLATMQQKEAVVVLDPRAINFVDSPVRLQHLVKPLAEADVQNIVQLCGGADAAISALKLLDAERVQVASLHELVLYLRVQTKLEQKKHYATAPQVLAVYNYLFHPSCSLFGDLFPYSPQFRPKCMQGRSIVDEIMLSLIKLEEATPKVADLEQLVSLDDVLGLLALVDFELPLLLQLLDSLASKNTVVRSMPSLSDATVRALSTAILPHQQLVLGSLLMSKNNRLLSSFQSSRIEMSALSDILHVCSLDQLPGVSTVYDLAPFGEGAVLRSASFPAQFPPCAAMLAHTYLQLAATDGSAPKNVQELVQCVQDIRKRINLLCAQAEAVLRDAVHGGRSVLHPGALRDITPATIFHIVVGTKCFYRILHALESVLAAAEADSAVSLISLSDVVYCVSVDMMAREVRHFFLKGDVAQDRRKVIDCLSKHPLLQGKRAEDITLAEIDDLQCSIGSADAVIDTICLLDDTQPVSDRVQFLGRIHHTHAAILDQATSLYNILHSQESSFLTEHAKMELTLKECQQIIRKHRFGSSLTDFSQKLRQSRSIVSQGGEGLQNCSSVSEFLTKLGDIDSAFALSMSEADAHRNELRTLAIAMGALKANNSFLFINETVEAKLLTLSFLSAQQQNDRAQMRVPFTSILSGQGFYNASDIQVFYGVDRTVNNISHVHRCDNLLALLGKASVPHERRKEATNTFDYEALLQRIKQLPKYGLGSQNEVTLHNGHFGWTMPKTKGKASSLPQFDLDIPTMLVGTCGDPEGLNAFLKIHVAQVHLLLQDCEGSTTTLISVLHFLNSTGITFNPYNLVVPLTEPSTGVRLECLRSAVVTVLSHLRDQTSLLLMQLRDNSGQVPSIFFRTSPNAFVSVVSRSTAELGLTELSDHNPYRISLANVPNTYLMEPKEVGEAPVLMPAFPLSGADLLKLAIATKTSVNLEYVCNMQSLRFADIMMITWTQSQECSEPSLNMSLSMLERLYGTSVTVWVRDHAGDTAISNCHGTMPVAVPVAFLHSIGLPVGNLMFETIIDSILAEKQHIDANNTSFLTINKLQKDAALLQSLSGSRVQIAGNTRIWEPAAAVTESVETLGNHIDATRKLLELVDDDEICSLRSVVCSFECRLTASLVEVTDVELMQLWVAADRSAATAVSIIYSQQAEQRVFFDFSGVIEAVSLIVNRSRQRGSAEYIHARTVIVQLLVEASLLGLIAIDDWKPISAHKNTAPVVNDVDENIPRIQDISDLFQYVSEHRTIALMKGSLQEEQNIRAFHQQLSSAYEAAADQLISSVAPYMTVFEQTTLLQVLFSEFLGDEFLPSSQDAEAKETDRHIVLGKGASVRVLAILILNRKFQCKTNWVAGAALLAATLLTHSHCRVWETSPHKRELQIRYSAALSEDLLPSTFAQKIDDLMLWGVRSRWGEWMNIAHVAANIGVKGTCGEDQGIHIERNTISAFLPANDPIKTAVNGSYCAGFVTDETKELFLGSSGGSIVIDVLLSVLWQHRHKDSPTLPDLRRVDRLVAESLKPIRMLHDGLAKLLFMKTRKALVKGRAGAVDTEGHYFARNPYAKQGRGSLYYRMRDKSMSGLEAHYNLYADVLYTVAEMNDLTNENSSKSAACAYNLSMVNGALTLRDIILHLRMRQANRLMFRSQEELTLVSFLNSNDVVETGLVTSRTAAALLACSRHNAQFFYESVPLCGTGRSSVVVAIIQQLRARKNAQHFERQAQLLSQENSSRALLYSDRVSLGQAPYINLNEHCEADHGELLHWNQYVGVHVTHFNGVSVDESTDPNNEKKENKKTREFVAVEDQLPLMPYAALPYISTVQQQQMTDPVSFLFTTCDDLIRFVHHAASSSHTRTGSIAHFLNHPACTLLPKRDVHCTLDQDPPVSTTLVAHNTFLRGENPLDSPVPVRKYEAFSPVRERGKRLVKTNLNLRLSVSVTEHQVQQLLLYSHSDLDILPLLWVLQSKRKRFLNVEQLAQEVLKLRASTLVSDFDSMVYSEVDPRSLDKEGGQLVQKIRRAMSLPAFTLYPISYSGHAANQLTVAAVLTFPFTNKTLRLSHCYTGNNVITTGVNVTDVQLKHSIWIRLFSEELSEMVASKEARDPARHITKPGQLFTLLMSSNCAFSLNTVMKIIKATNGNATYALETLAVLSRDSELAAVVSDLVRGGLTQFLNSMHLTPENQVYLSPDVVPILKFRPSFKYVTDLAYKKPFRLAVRLVYMVQVVFSLITYLKLQTLRTLKMMQEDQKDKSAIQANTLYTRLQTVMERQTTPVDLLYIYAKSSIGVQNTISLLKSYPTVTFDTLPEAGNLSQISRTVDSVCANKALLVVSSIVRPECRDSINSVEKHKEQLDVLQRARKEHTESLERVRKLINMQLTEGHLLSSLWSNTMINERGAVGSKPMPSKTMHLIKEFTNQSLALSSTSYEALVLELTSLGLTKLAKKLTVQWNSTMTEISAKSSGLSNADYSGQSTPFTANSTGQNTPFSGMNTPQSPPQTSNVDAPQQQQQQQRQTLTRARSKDMSGSTTQLTPINSVILTDEEWDALLAPRIASMTTHRTDWFSKASATTLPLQTVTNSAVSDLLHNIALHNENNFLPRLKISNNDLKVLYATSSSPAALYCHLHLLVHSKLKFDNVHDVASALSHISTLTTAMHNDILSFLRSNYTRIYAVGTEEADLETALDELCDSERDDENEAQVFQSKRKQLNNTTTAGPSHALQHTQAFLLGDSSEGQHWVETLTLTDVERLMTQSGAGVFTLFCLNQLKLGGKSYSSFLEQLDGVVCMIHSLSMVLSPLIHFAVTLLRSSDLLATQPTVTQAARDLTKQIHPDLREMQLNLGSGFGLGLGLTSSSGYGADMVRIIGEERGGAEKGDLKRINMKMEGKQLPLPVDWSTLSSTQSNASEFVWSSVLLSITESLPLLVYILGHMTAKKLTFATHVELCLHVREVVLSKKLHIGSVQTFLQSAHLGDSVIPTADVQNDGPTYHLGGADRLIALPTLNSGSAKAGKRQPSRGSVDLGNLQDLELTDQRPPSGLTLNQARSKLSKLFVAKFESKTAHAQAMKEPLYHPVKVDRAAENPQHICKLAQLLAEAVGRGYIDDGPPAILRAIERSTRSTLDPTLSRVYLGFQSNPILLFPVLFLLNHTIPEPIDVVDGGIVFCESILTFWRSLVDMSHLTKSIPSSQAALHKQATHLRHESGVLKSLMQSGNMFRLENSIATALFTKDLYAKHEHECEMQIMTNSGTAGMKDSALLDADESKTQAAFRESGSGKKSSFFIHPLWSFHDNNLILLQSSLGFIQSTFELSLTSYLVCSGLLQRDSRDISSMCSIEQLRRCIGAAQGAGLLSAPFDIMNMIKNFDVESSTMIQDHLQSNNSPDKVVKPVATVSAIHSLIFVLERLRKQKSVFVDTTQLLQTLYAQNTVINEQKYAILNAFLGTALRNILGWDMHAVALDIGASAIKESSRAEEDKEEIAVEAESKAAQTLRTLTENSFEEKLSKLDMNREIRLYESDYAEFIKSHLFLNSDVTLRISRDGKNEMQHNNFVEYPELGGSQRMGAHLLEESVFTVSPLPTPCELHYLYIELQIAVERLRGFRQETLSVDAENIVKGKEHDARTQSCLDVLLLFATSLHSSRLCVGSFSALMSALHAWVDLVVLSISGQHLNDTSTPLGAYPTRSSVGFGTVCATTLGVGYTKYQAYPGDSQMSVTLLPEAERAITTHKPTVIDSIQCVDVSTNYPYYSPVLGTFVKELGSQLHLYPSATTYNSSLLLHISIPDLLFHACGRDVYYIWLRRELQSVSLKRLEQLLFNGVLEPYLMLQMHTRRICVQRARRLADTEDKLLHNKFRIELSAGVGKRSLRVHDQKNDNAHRGNTQEAEVDLRKRRDGNQLRLQLLETRVELESNYLIEQAALASDTFALDWTVDWDIAYERNILHDGHSIGFDAVGGSSTLPSKNALTDQTLRKRLDSVRDDVDSDIYQFASIRAISKCIEHNYYFNYSMTPYIPNTTAVTVFNEFGILTTDVKPSFSLATLSNLTTLSSTTIAGLGAWSAEENAAVLSKQAEVERELIEGTEWSPATLLEKEASKRQFAPMSREFERYLFNLQLALDKVKAVEEPVRMPPRTVADVLLELEDDSGPTSELAAVTETNVVTPLQVNLVLELGCTPLDVPDLIVQAKEHLVLAHVDYLNGAEDFVVAHTMPLGEAVNTVDPERHTVIEPLMGTLDMYGSVASIFEPVGDLLVNVRKSRKKEQHSSKTVYRIAVAFPLDLPKQDVFEGNNITYITNGSMPTRDSFYIPPKSKASCELSARQLLLQPAIHHCNCDYFNYRESDRVQANKETCVHIFPESVFENSNATLTLLSNSAIVAEEPFLMELREMLTPISSEALLTKLDDVYARAHSAMHLLLMKNAQGSNSASNTPAANMTDFFAQSPHIMMPVDRDEMGRMRVYCNSTDAKFHALQTQLQCNIMTFIEHGYVSALSQVLYMYPREALLPHNAHACTEIASFSSLAAPAHYLDEQHHLLTEPTNRTFGSALRLEHNSDGRNQYLLRVYQITDLDPVDPPGITHDPSVITAIGAEDTFFANTDRSESLYALCRLCLVPDPLYNRSLQRPSIVEPGILAQPSVQPAANGKFISQINQLLERDNLQHEDSFLPLATLVSGLFPTQEKQLHAALPTKQVKHAELCCFLNASKDPLTALVVSRLQPRHIHAESIVDVSNLAPMPISRSVQKDLATSDAAFETSVEAATSQVNVFRAFNPATTTVSAVLSITNHHGVAMLAQQIVDTVSAHITNETILAGNQPVIEEGAHVFSPLKSLCGNSGIVGKVSLVRAKGKVIDLSMRACVSGVVRSTLQPSIQAFCELQRNNSALPDPSMEAFKYNLDESMVATQQDTGYVIDDEEEMWNERIKQTLGTADCYQTLLDSSMADLIESEDCLNTGSILEVQQYSSVLINTTESAQHHVVWPAIVYSGTSTSRNSFQFSFNKYQLCYHAYLAMLILTRSSRVLLPSLRSEINSPLALLWLSEPMPYLKVPMVTYSTLITPVAHPAPQALRARQNEGFEVYSTTTAAEGSTPTFETPVVLPLSVSSLCTPAALLKSKHYLNYSHNDINKNSITSQLQPFQVSYEFLDSAAELHSHNAVPNVLPLVMAPPAAYITRHEKSSALVTPFTATPRKPNVGSVLDLDQDTLLVPPPIDDGVLKLAVKDDLHPGVQLMEAWVSPASLMLQLQETVVHIHTMATTQAMMCPGLMFKAQQNLVQKSGSLTADLHTPRHISVVSPTFSKHPHMLHHAAAAGLQSALSAPQVNNYQPHSLALPNALGVTCSTASPLASVGMHHRQTQRLPLSTPIAQDLVQRSLMLAGLNREPSMDMSKLSSLSASWTKVDQVLTHASVQTRCIQVPLRYHDGTLAHGSYVLLSVNVDELSDALNLHYQTEHELDRLRTSEISRREIEATSRLNQSLKRNILTCCQSIVTVLTNPSAGHNLALKLPATVKTQLSLLQRMVGESLWKQVTLSFDNIALLDTKTYVEHCSKKGLHDVVKDLVQVIEGHMSQVPKSTATPIYFSPLLPALSLSDAEVLLSLTNNDDTLLMHLLTPQLTSYTLTQCHNALQFQFELDQYKPSASDSPPLEQVKMLAKHLYTNHIPVNSTVAVHSSKHLLESLSIQYALHVKEHRAQMKGYLTRLLSITSLRLCFQALCGLSIQQIHHLNLLFVENDGTLPELDVLDFTDKHIDQLIFSAGSVGKFMLVIDRLLSTMLDSSVDLQEVVSALADEPNGPLEIISDSIPPPVNVPLKCGSLLIKYGDGVSISANKIHTLQNQRAQSFRAHWRYHERLQPSHLERETQQPTFTLVQSYNERLETVVGATMMTASTSGPRKESPTTLASVRNWSKFQCNIARVQKSEQRSLGTSIANSVQGVLKYKKIKATSKSTATVTSSLLSYFSQTKAPAATTSTIGKDKKPLESALYSGLEGVSVAQEARQLITQSDRVTGRLVEILCSRVRSEVCDILTKETKDVEPFVHTAQRGEESNSSTDEKNDPDNEGDNSSDWTIWSQFVAQFGSNAAYVSSHHPRACSAASWYMPVQASAFHHHHNAFFPILTPRQLSWILSYCDQTVNSLIYACRIVSSAHMVVHSPMLLVSALQNVRAHMLIEPYIVEQVQNNLVNAGLARTSAIRELHRTCRDFVSQVHTQVGEDAEEWTKAVSRPNSLKKVVYIPMMLPPSGMDTSICFIDRETLAQTALQYELPTPRTGWQHISFERAVPSNSVLTFEDFSLRTLCAVPTVSTALSTEQIPEDEEIPAVLEANTDAHDTFQWTIALAAHPLLPLLSPSVATAYTQQFVQLHHGYSGLLATQSGVIANTISNSTHIQTCELCQQALREPTPEAMQHCARHVWVLLNVNLGLLSYTFVFNVLPISSLVLDLAAIDKEYVQSASRADQVVYKGVCRQLASNVDTNVIAATLTLPIARKAMPKTQDYTDHGERELLLTDANTVAVYVEDIYNTQCLAVLLRPDDVLPLVHYVSYRENGWTLLRSVKDLYKSANQAAAGEDELMHDAMEGQTLSKPELAFVSQLNAHGIASAVMLGPFSDILKYEGRLRKVQQHHNEHKASMQGCVQGRFNRVVLHDQAATWFAHVCKEIHWWLITGLHRAERAAAVALLRIITRPMTLFVCLHQATSDGCANRYIGNVTVQCELSEDTLDAIRTTKTIPNKLVLQIYSLIEKLRDKQGNSVYVLNEAVELCAHPQSVVSRLFEVSLWKLLNKKLCSLHDSTAVDNNGMCSVCNLMVTCPQMAWRLQFSLEEYHDYLQNLVNGDVDQVFEQDVISPYEVEKTDITEPTEEEIQEKKCQNIMDYLNNIMQPENSSILQGSIVNEKEKSPQASPKASVEEDQTADHTEDNVTESNEPRTNIPDNNDMSSGALIGIQEEDDVVGEIVLDSVTEVTRNDDLTLNTTMLNDTTTLDSNTLNDDVSLIDNTTLNDTTTLDSNTLNEPNHHSKQAETVHDTTTAVATLDANTTFDITTTLNTTTLDMTTNSELLPAHIPLNFSNSGNGDELALNQQTTDGSFKMDLYVEDTEQNSTTTNDDGSSRAATNDTTDGTNSSLYLTTTTEIDTEKDEETTSLVEDTIEATELQSSLLTDNDSAVTNISLTRADNTLNLADIIDSVTMNSTTEENDIEKDVTIAESHSESQLVNNEELSEIVPLPLSTNTPHHSSGVESPITPIPLPNLQNQPLPAAAELDSFENEPISVLATPQHLPVRPTPPAGAPVYSRRAAFDQNKINLQDLRDARQNIAIVERDSEDSDEEDQEQLNNFITPVKTTH